VIAVFGPHPRTYDVGSSANAQHERLDARDLQCVGIRRVNKQGRHWNCRCREFAKEVASGEHAVSLQFRFEYLNSGVARPAALAAHDFSTFTERTAGSLVACGLF
jgi:hypothetical protein